MKIFIPEGFIYFYVYGGGDNLIDLFYGTMDSIIYESAFFYSNSPFDVFFFKERKIMWGPGWKGTYFHFESPFFKHLAINDRYNWAYNHTMYKLLSNQHHSIFLTKCASIKGFHLSPSRYLFLSNTYVTGRKLLYYSNHGYDFFIFGSCIRQGFSHKHDWNHIAHIIFLFNLNYSFLFLEFFNKFSNFFFYHLIIIYLSISYLYIYTIFLIVFLWIVLYYFFKYALEIEKNMNNNIDYFSTVIDDYDWFLNKFLFSASESKSYIYIVITLINFFFKSRYKVIEGYNKIFVVFLLFKKFFFKINYSFIFFVFILSFKRIYRFFVEILSLPFYIFEWFFWSFRYLTFPFRIFVSRYADDYLAIFKRQLNYWFFCFVMFIINNLREDTIKASLLGWIKWTQISARWDEFVDNEWLKIDKMVFEEYRRKEEEKIKEQKSKLQKLWDDIERDKLRKEGIDAEQIEKIIEYQHKVKKQEEEAKQRSKKNINIKVVDDPKISFKTYEKTFFEERKKVKKKKSILWSKLYNLYIFKKYLKINEIYEEKLSLNMDREINNTFIKEMSYYNWLMERKYLFLQTQFSYYDFSEFMDFQEDMFKYYVETASVLGYISNFSEIFSYLYRSDTSYYKYAFVDQISMISSRVKGIDLGFLRIYYKLFNNESTFLKYILLNITNLLNVYSFLTCIFMYMSCYLWLLAYFSLSFIKLLLSSDRLLIKYYSIIIGRKLYKIRVFYIIYSIVVLLKKLFVYIYEYIKNKIYALFRLVNLFFKYLSDNYSELYYKIKTYMFDLWFYFYVNWAVFLERFKRIVMFFVVLYICAGITPYEFFLSIFSLLSNMLFEICATLIPYSNLSFWYIYFSEYIYELYKESYIWYLYNMFNINTFIFLLVKPLLIYIRTILYYPLYLIFSLEVYQDLIVSWTFYDYKLLQDIQFSIKDEISNEMEWRANHFYKAVFGGGFIWHPIYKIIMNKNDEIGIICRFLWHDVFDFSYKIQISFFLFRLPGYVFVFPYWMLRYGPYYIIWQYLQFNVDSMFIFHLCYYYIITLLYIKYYIFGWFFISLSVFTIYPFIFYEFFVLFFYSLSLNLLVFISGYIVSGYIIYILLFFNNVINCILNYYNMVHPLVVYVWSFMYPEYMRILLSIQVISKILSSLYIFAIGGFKVFLHFYQCYIPYIKYVVKYDIYLFLIVMDLFRSILSLLAIFYHFFTLPFYIVWSFLCKFYSYYSGTFFGIFLGSLSEFLYKFAFYPYYVLYIDGFFEHYGKYSFRSGYGWGTTMYQAIQFGDIVDLVVRRDYVSVHKRWSLIGIDDYNNLDYGFPFRFMSYREIGGATAFFHLYIWIRYIVFLSVLCFMFNYMSKYLKHKDNVFTDSSYLWYRLTPENKFKKFSNYEYLWMTDNKWLFSFGRINGLFEKDYFMYYKDKREDLSKLSLRYVKSSKKRGFETDFESKTDFNRFIDYLLNYSSLKYYKKLWHIAEKNWKAIRYQRINQKVNSLFKWKIKNKAFATMFLNSIDFKLSKRVKVDDLNSISESKKFWDFWFNFGFPVTMHGNYSYASLRSDKDFDLYKFYKMLKLIIMEKDDKFKDLHDFYFLDTEFYDDLNDTWLWSRQDKGNLLRHIVNSRYTNRMVYSSRDRLKSNSNLLDKDFMDYLYNYLDKLIKLSNSDSIYFNNILNFRMHNIFTSDKIVETQLTAKEIERRVLEEYTDFMETGWEQDRMEDGHFAVYKYLSDRLYASFLDNDLSTEEGIFLSRVDLSRKISLRNFYTPLPDPWMAISIILPLIVAVFVYKFFVIYSIGTVVRRPLYVYEICFFLVYFSYYINPHVFYASITSTLMFYPKLYNRRRKLRTFSTSRLLSIIENFMPNDRLLKLLVNFSAFTPALLFIKPAYDFVIFYLIFVVCAVIFYKFIVDFDIA